MRKSTKGALAGVAAVALLMGGFGTRATWEDSATIDQAPIQDGHLTLSGGCNGWKLLEGIFNAEDELTSTGDALRTGLTNLSNVYLLPGQVLTRHCAFTVHLAGVADAKVDIDAANVSGVTQATNGLSLATVFANGSDPLTPDTNGAVVGASVADGDVISADFTATLAPDALQSVWGDVSGTLDSMGVKVSM